MRKKNLKKNFWKKFLYFFGKLSLTFAYLSENPEFLIIWKFEKKKLRKKKKKKKKNWKKKILEKKKSWKFFFIFFFFQISI